MLLAISLQDRLPQGSTDTSGSPQPFENTLWESFRHLELEFGSFSTGQGRAVRCQYASLDLRFQNESRPSFGRARLLSRNCDGISSPFYGRPRRYAGRPAFVIPFAQRTEIYFHKMLKRRF